MLQGDPEGGFVRILSLAMLVTLSVLGCARREAPKQIIFPAKAFYDSAQAIGDTVVYVAGTLTGEHVGYPNNSTVIACYKDRMECLTYSVEQIGPNQIGRVDAPTFYPVVKWDDHEVLAAGDGDAFKCTKLTISIVRKSQSALWVLEPVNASRPECKNAPTTIEKWAIEDSPAWKAMSKR